MFAAAFISSLVFFCRFRAEPFLLRLRSRSKSVSRLFLEAAGALLLLHGQVLLVFFSDLHSSLHVAWLSCFSCGWPLCAAYPPRRYADAPTYDFWLSWRSKSWSGRRARRLWGACLRGGWAEMLFVIVVITLVFEKVWVSGWFACCCCSLCLKFSARLALLYQGRLDSNG